MGVEQQKEEEDESEEELKKGNPSNDCWEMVSFCFALLLPSLNSTAIRPPPPPPYNNENSASGLCNHPLGWRSICETLVEKYFIICFVLLHTSYSSATAGMEWKRDGRMGGWWWWSCTIFSPWIASGVMDGWAAGGESWGKVSIKKPVKWILILTVSGENEEDWVEEDVPQRWDYCWVMLF